MPLWLQHLIVLALVVACLTYVGYHGFRTLLGKRSKLGSCCAKGCPTDRKTPDPNAKRVIFLPSDLLRKRR